MGGRQWAQCLQMRKEIFRFGPGPFPVFGFVFGLKNHFADVFVEISVLIRLYGICALHQPHSCQKGGLPLVNSLPSGSIIGQLRFWRYVDKHITINSTSRGIY